MSLELHRDKQLGWAYEATEGVDPIASGGGTPYYKFGKYTKTFGHFPQKTVKTMAVYHGSRDPSNYISHVQPKGAVAFAPVNAIPWYQFLGARADGGGGIHTITGIDSGELPFMTTRFQSENASESIRKSFVGGKLDNLNFVISNANTRARSPAFIGMGLKGMDVKTPTNTAAQVPVFPSSEEGMYHVDDNFEFTWDYGGGSPVTEYKDQLLEFRYIGMNANIIGTVGNTITPYQILEGVRSHIVQFQILRGGDTQIYDDYIGQTRASTGKDLRVKIYNSATNYLQLDLNNILIEDCKMNDGYQAQSELEIYDVVGIAQDITVNSIDGCAASFYQD